MIRTKRNLGVVVVALVLVLVAALVVWVQLLGPDYRLSGYSVAGVSHPGTDQITLDVAADELTITIGEDSYVAPYRLVDGRLELRDLAIFAPVSGFDSAAGAVFYIVDQALDTKRVEVTDSDTVLVWQTRGVTLVWTK